MNCFGKNRVKLAIDHQFFFRSPTQHIEWGWTRELYTDCYGKTIRIRSSSAWNVFHTFVLKFRFAQVGKTSFSRAIREAIIADDWPIGFVVIFSSICRTCWKHIYSLEIPKRLVSWLVSCFSLEYFFLETATPQDSFIIFYNIVSVIMRKKSIIDIIEYHRIS